MSLQEVYTAGPLSMNKPDSVWTHDSVAILKDRWANPKLRAKDIARELNELFGEHFTKRSVIGKANRLGLQARKTSETNSVLAQNRELKKRINQIRSCGVQPAQLPTVEPHVFDASIPILQRKTLLELTESCCRFIVGDPLTEESFFCGGEQYASSYCEHHYRRCIERRLK